MARCAGARSRQGFGAARAKGVGRLKDVRHRGPGSWWHRGWLRTAWTRGARCCWCREAFERARPTRHCCAPLFAWPLPASRRSSSTVSAACRTSIPIRTATRCTRRSKPYGPRSEAAARSCSPLSSMPARYPAHSRTSWSGQSATPTWAPSTTSGGVDQRVGISDGSRRCLPVACDRARLRACRSCARGMRKDPRHPPNGWQRGPDHRPGRARERHRCPRCARHFDGLLAQLEELYVRPHLRD